MECDLYKISCSIFPWKLTVILWWVLLSQSKLWYQTDGLQARFNLVVIKPAVGAEIHFSVVFFNVGLHMVMPCVGTVLYYAFVRESNSRICGLCLFIQEEDVLWVHLSLEYFLWFCYVRSLSMQQNKWAVIDHSVLFTVVEWMARILIGRQNISR